MADLFTRLVSGPSVAAAVPLAPRVPFETPPLVEEESFAPSALEQAAPQPLAGEVVRREVVVREVPGEVVPPASSPSPLLSPSHEAVDLGGLGSLQQPQSSKISPPEPGMPAEPPPDKSSKVLPRAAAPAIRPREHQPEPPAVSPRQMRQAQSAPQEQTVRITIGRIEIRAPQPTVAPQPMASPAAIPQAPQGPQGPQGLSLADYLRGNDGRPR